MLQLWKCRSESSYILLDRLEKHQKILKVCVIIWSDVCISESINTWFHPSPAWLPLIIAEATWPECHNVIIWRRWQFFIEMKNDQGWCQQTWGTWDTVVTRREHYTVTLSSLTWPHFYINYINNIFPELALSHRKLSNTNIQNLSMWQFH